MIFVFLLGSILYEILQIFFAQILIRLAFQKKDKEFQGGNLQLIHGSRMFLSPSTLSLKPKVGDFYFFPNYMMHTVFPFNGTDEERRSISFNARIDENIYNVYGG